MNECASESLNGCYIRVRERSDRKCNVSDDWKEESNFCGRPYLERIATIKDKNKRAKIINYFLNNNLITIIKIITGNIILKIINKGDDDMLIGSNPFETAIIPKITPIITENI